MPVYEMTPERFDGSSDVTDGLILWVKAPNLKAIVEYGKKTGFEGKVDKIADKYIGPGVDFEVDEKGKRLH